MGLPTFTDMQVVEEKGVKISVRQSECHLLVTLSLGPTQSRPTNPNPKRPRLVVSWSRSWDGFQADLGPLGWRTEHEHQGDRSEVREVGASARNESRLQGQSQEGSPSCLTT